MPHPRPIWLVAEKYQLASGVPVEDFPRLLPEDYYYPRIRRVDHPVHNLREQTRTQNVLLSTNADQSAATADVAARVSVDRPCPDGTPCEAGGVGLLSAEDGLADTNRSRLDAAGGDPSRVLALATTPDAGAWG